MTETVYDLDGARVWVAGHTGMVGSAVVRRLAEEPIGDLITARSSDVDLRRQDRPNASWPTPGPTSSSSLRHVSGASMPTGRPRASSSTTTS